ncbi:MAG: helix-turn-helix domain-containing protein [Burkholderiales bacterium]|nr:helix-turn-helix domain-containing protein [Burkholderiales bacterium]
MPADRSHRRRVPALTVPRAHAIEPPSGGGVAAVDRALAIVAAFESDARPLALADVARATGMYKSTLLRLLTSLERSGLVVRRGDQRYALGQFAYRLGRAYEATYPLKECVWPVLEWLIAQGTESPSFHVRHDDRNRLCLLRIDSNHPTLDRVRAGDLLPLRRGAPGTVLRQFRGGLPVAADDPLFRVSFGERDPSCAAVAAPVFGAGGELIGALSLSGPLERFSEAAAKKMAKPLLAAAATATRALGAEWPSRASGTSQRMGKPR